MKKNLLITIIFLIMVSTICGCEKLEKKVLIPAVDQTTSSKSFKTTYKANVIVLDGKEYTLGVDKLSKYLENGFVSEKAYDEEITNSLQVRGYFKSNPEAIVYLDFHTPDHRTKTKSKDCVVDYVEVYLKPNTAKTYYWKLYDLVIDENTTKTEVNNYFNLEKNGSNKVNLYTDDFLVELQCGGIYDEHKYSNIFTIRARKYSDNMKFPEWAE